ncbi:hypothetical protein [Heliobacterium chlorum]|uniref:hypothetical protein n=1 Tax=Heliobacterium chlorum TaxID=2698 RepID=UPI003C6CA6BA
MYDHPRSGAPSKFTVNQRCELIAIACDNPSQYGFGTYPIWTLTILSKVAKQQGFPMSRCTVGRTLRENALRPHKKTNVAS